MRIGSHDFDFTGRVYVMGILNVTPDSFSDGGRFQDPERALDQALRMQEEGADLIDVGAESTRPGADPVSAEEERSRLLPVLQKIAPRIKIPLSIDTQKADVADGALAEGGAMINDVSALDDGAMAGVVVRRRAAVILMHRRGNSKTMQTNLFYENVVSEISEFLRERTKKALSLGIAQDRILIDPGLGFGKRFEDNEKILQGLSHMKGLGFPIVIGASRKAFLKRRFGENPENLLAGSVAAALTAAEKGAGLLRVHDVAVTKAAIRLAGCADF